MISCKDYVTIRKDQLKREIAGHQVSLLVIQVDSNPASTSYINGKRNDCKEVGISLLYHNVLSQHTTQEEFECLVREYANSSQVHGVIIQLPIPDCYDLNRLLACIPPEKDVDGFRRDSTFESCTPKGIIDWLDFNGYEFEGKGAVVLGRSNIVGKPLVNMLIDRGATVTCCNSHTSREVASRFMRQASLVISAIGKPNYWNMFDFTESNDIVIDVGTNRDENGKLCGDIDRFEVDIFCPENIYITPVPGGVGLLTRLALMENTWKAYKNLTGN